MNDMSKTKPAVMRTPLGRVRGLGSAKSGTHHWWMQRVTSIALLPLTLWFVVSMLSLAGASYAQTRAFLAWPVNAVLMLALIGLTFHHIAAGLQVVVEDYVRKEMQRIAALLVIKGGCWLMALVCAFAVLRVAFT
jgi:succinate dehydrogenase / fumarate reductase membrane anchor subunit